mmetsp:Transcript_21876/g.46156  ORF Transcript_21876/g.46156 Transcript_21876/m.46156 type:complete len:296 (-) Transcript_21876:164-1051(-)|eukprot:CAMPEP_0201125352 /NCGR_PEP_ID=MMETSP0850-20130426/20869_1 /ASSEMBLY_ACC=CAM_ASM_000622 /TAXON_ID=183588 /ORGANISM="Pseudo-nitzschia fraudulenta, Strain WWA7" /LENGTH=295 /DNA_ID=CAMNT_0047393331 /DNA_START=83 /DNA_END=970 /DNA_ORIENTATION=-
MQADEETSLIAGVAPGFKKQKLVVNIEFLRFFGLSMGMVLLGVGTFMSTYMVVFPPHEDTHTFMEKLKGAQSDFDTTQTYIYKLFHFNHTCTMLDFNPAKTCAALVIMLHTLPCLAFVVLHHVQVLAMTDPKYNNLKTMSNIFSPLQFIFYLYFYMVFVNSPNGEYGTRDGKMKFTFHYIPYMLWQMGILLMGIQQCWYVSLRGEVPFPSIFTKETIWNYVCFLMFMFVLYSTFVWSFIFEAPLWNTESSVGKTAAMFVMYGWDVFAVLVPMCFAWVESKRGNSNVIEFYEMVSR